MMISKVLLMQLNTEHFKWYIQICQYTYKVQGGKERYKDGETV